MNYLATQVAALAQTVAHARALKHGQSWRNPGPKNRMRGRPRYGGAELRCLRAERGVGRPPGTLSISAGLLARGHVGNFLGFTICREAGVRLASAAHNASVMLVPPRGMA